MWVHSTQYQMHLWVLRQESDKQQEFWEKCRSGVTPPVRGAMQVHMSYTWNGLRSSSWKPSRGVKSHQGVTSCQNSPSPCLSLTDPPPAPPFVTCRHLSPPAWPADVTRVQPRAASAATEGATWWSGTVKAGDTLTAECSSHCGKLEGQLSVGHRRLDRLIFHREGVFIFLFLCVWLSAANYHAQPVTIKKPFSIMPYS